MDDGRFDLNELRRRVRDYGSERIADLYKPDGYAWVYNYIAPDTENWRRVADKIKAQEGLSEEEKNWAQRLEALIEYLGIMKNSLAQTRGTPSIQIISGFANFLEPLVEGFIDPSDPDCPACPEKKEGVTWESWRNKISPRNFMIDASHRPYVQSERGVRYPSGLIR